MKASNIVFYFLGPTRQQNQLCEKDQLGVAKGVKKLLKTTETSQLCNMTLIFPSYFQLPLCFLYSLHMVEYHETNMRCNISYSPKHKYCKNLLRLNHLYLPRSAVQSLKAICIMVTQVVEFSRRGYKIRKIFA